jgi:hypothetical protein
LYNNIKPNAPVSKVLTELQEDSMTIIHQEDTPAVFRWLIAQARLSDTGRRWNAKGFMVPAPAAG